MYSPILLLQPWYRPWSTMISKTLKATPPTLIRRRPFSWNKLFMAMLNTTGPLDHTAHADYSWPFP